MKILITRPIHEDGLSLLRNKGVDFVCSFSISREELLDSVSSYDAIIIRSDVKVDRELLMRAKNLKVVGVAGIGVNQVDLPLARSLGIEVMNVPDGSVESVAQLAIGFFIAAARKIVVACVDTKQKNWNKAAYTGHTLDGKTLGIVALGRIGTRVAEIANALKMRVIAYDPYLDESDIRARGAQKVELEELLRESDFVSIHSPLNNETYRLIGAKELALMKEDSFLFNLARGGIVDEDALYEVLASGRLKAAGLDVMEVEPDKQSRLFELDNVFITPHIGAGTVESQQYIARSIVTKVTDYLDQVEEKRASLEAVAY